MHLLKKFLIDEIGFFSSSNLSREGNKCLSEIRLMWYMYTATDARVITDNSIIYIDTKSMSWDVWKIKECSPSLSSANTFYI